jgi:hypothetical protein
VINLIARRARCKQRMRYSPCTNRRASIARKNAKGLAEAIKKTRRPLGRELETRYKRRSIKAAMTKLERAQLRSVPIPTFCQMVDSKLYRGEPATKINKVDTSPATQRRTMAPVSIASGRLLMALSLSPHNAVVETRASSRRLLNNLLHTVHLNPTSKLPACTQTALGSKGCSTNHFQVSSG